MSTYPVKAWAAPPSASAQNARGEVLLTQGAIVAVENAQRKLFGLQYHPEVMHSERGMATLRRFLFDVAAIPADWKIENVLEEEMEKLRQTVQPET